MEVKQVTLGVSTVNDHERRITELEEKMEHARSFWEKLITEGPDEATKAMESITSPITPPIDELVESEEKKKRGRPPKNKEIENAVS